MIVNWKENRSLVRSGSVRAFLVAALVVVGFMQADAVLAQNDAAIKKGGAKAQNTESPDRTFRKAIPLRQGRDGGEARNPLTPGTTELKEVDPNADQPIIAPMEMVHDFGEQWIGPKFEYTFKVKNKGTKPLEITRVRPSCGCTIAGNYPRKLDPGETGDFPFAIDSTKVRGRYEKYVTVTSNDPVNSDIKLRLRGEVKRYVDVLPAAANFGRIVGSDVQERVLKVTNNTENPLELELDTENDTIFDFNLVEVEPGKQFELRVKTKPDVDQGAYRSNAILKTNVDAQREIKVIATGTVPSRLDVVPNQIILPNTAPGSADRDLIRIVRFSNYGSTPVKVTEAKVDSDQIKTTINERTPGKNYDIRIEIPGSFNPPVTGNTLTLMTDDAKQPRLEIPVRGIARPTPQAQAKNERPKRPVEQMVGQSIPEFSLQTVDGKELSTDTAKQDVTVLDFFAVNCGFCSKQIPRVEKIREEYEGKDVRFVAVGQTMRKPYTQEQTQDKLKSLGFKGEFVYDSENTLGPKFKSTSYPTMVVLGRDGKIAAANVGNIGDLETRLKGQLDALLAGKPVPTFENPSPSKRPERPNPNDLVGKPAPSFKLRNVAGETVSSDGFSEHKATVLNFVAPNCGFCKKQLPNVEKVREKYEAKGVRFVNMSQTMRKPFSAEEAADIYKGTGAELELVMDDGNKVGSQYKARGYPTMIVVGQDGKVANVNVGAKKNLEELLSGQLEELIKKAG